MDAFLLAAVGHEIAQFGGGVESPLLANGRWGAEAQVLVLPELGAKAQLFVGSNYADPVYWQLAAGAAVFREAVPRGGTEGNVALSLRVGYVIDDDWGIFVEANHYSNGSVFSSRSSSENPGYDRLLAGVVWHF